MKITKIAFIFLIYLFLNGCIQSTALLGPGITVVTSGNVLQAGFQYGANTAIKNHFSFSLNERVVYINVEKSINIIL